MESNITYAYMHEMYQIITDLKNAFEQKIEKRWFDIDQAAEYTCYKKDTIKLFIRNGDLEEGKHYYQKNKKQIFDKSALDDFIMSSSKSLNSEIKSKLNSILNAA